VALNTKNIPYKECDLPLQTQLKRCKLEDQCYYLCECIAAISSIMYRIGAAVWMHTYTLAEVVSGLLNV
jgi:hypothetical protein